MVALSLNKDDGKNQLLDYVAKVIDSGIIHSNRNYEFLINGSSRTFKIKIHNRKNHYNDANKTILLYIYTIAHKKETSDLEKHFCLKLELKGNRTKNKRQYFFTESYIHGIYKHKCSNPIMNGKFIVQLAENINKIFKVKTSKLLDDSRLPICLENSDNTAVVSLKTIKLLQIGKTWYEKEAGFKLEDTKQYELAKKVQKIPLSSFLNIATNSNLHTMTESYINSNEDLKSIKQIKRIETILKKVNLSKESTFQEIAKDIFDFSNPEIKNCEKLEIWKTVISNNLVRKKVETLKEIPTWWEPQPSQKDIDNYKILTKWWPAASNWAASTSKKIYEYPIKRPRTSSRPSTKYGKRPRTSRRPFTAFGGSIISSTTKKNEKPTSLDELAKPKNPKKKELSKITEQKRKNADYKITDKIIGKGASGVVKIAIRKTDKKKFAVKIPVSAEELRISLIMSSAGIAPKVEDFFTNKNNKLNIIMELLQGLELTNFIEETDIIISKTQSQNLIKKIELLHKKGIIHNDLGTINVFVKLKNDTIEDIILIDFDKSIALTEKNAKRDYINLLATTRLIAGTKKKKNVKFLIEALKNKIKSL